MEKLLVIKIGGNVIDDEQLLEQFIADLAAVKEKKILVHGGGKLATRVAEAMGIPQTLVEGRRITDAETLKVVTMVYAGFINKQIVALLQKNKCNALGLTGADADLVRAHKRINNELDYGFAGDIDAVNVAFLSQLIAQDITAVVAPITHNGNGQLLNSNADTIARELAQAMSNQYEVTLVYCFEKPGVLRDVADPGSVISSLDSNEYLQLKAAGIIAQGMIPKLDNAFAALKQGVQQIVIGQASALPALIQSQSGTTIVHE